MRLSDPKAVDPETLSGFLRTACEEHAFHGPEEFCPYYDAANLIEYQQRTIARLSAPMSWDEYNSIFPAATDPMAAPPEIILDPYEVWNLLMDMRKEHLDHE
jgi:hypothetical protein